MVYGQHRFSVSERTFYNYVGHGKACPARPDGQFCVEDIEIIAKVQAWPPASLFVRGAQPGGEGGASPKELDIGAEIQAEKLEILKINRRAAEVDLQKKIKEVLPRKDFEQRLAAAAAIVGNEADVFVYDNVREIIHVCGGKPENEDSLREYLLGKVRGWCHAFSRPMEYEVEFEDRPEGNYGISLEALTDDAEKEGSQQVAYCGSE